MVHTTEEYSHMASVLSLTLTKAPLHSPNIPHSALKTKSKHNKSRVAVAAVPGSCAPPPPGRGGGLGLSPNASLRTPCASDPFALAVRCDLAGWLHFTTANFTVYLWLRPNTEMSWATRIPVYFEAPFFERQPARHWRSACQVLLLCYLFCCNILQPRGAVYPLGCHSI